MRLNLSLAPSRLSVLVKSSLSREPAASWLVQRLVNRSISSTSLRRARLPTPLNLFTPDPIDTYGNPPLTRGVPPRKGMLLLGIPLPPASWPPRLEMQSGLIAMTNSVIDNSGVSANAVYDGTGKEQAFRMRARDEVYTAKLYFADGRVIDYPRFDEEVVKSQQFKEDLAYQPDASIAARLDVSAGGNTKHHIFVCTHGSRDCRCADRGGPLVEALKAEVQRRGLEGQFSIGDIAHVGGHKWAANALLLPSLDMLSNLSPSHAPAVIAHLLNGSPVGSHIWAHWRGRYGLSEAAQQQLWDRVDPEKVDTSPEPVAGAATEKAMLRFKTFEGEVKEVEASLGEDLLVVGQRHNLPSIEGVCEGNLECATCHVYLKGHTPPVPEPSEGELDMLGYALGYKDGESRLGCQIKVTQELADWVKAGGIIGLPRF